jgi:hypothetical protein
MKVSQSTVRSVLSGIVIAAVLVFASSTLSARYCETAMLCGEGTALEGIEISCGCMGDGTCSGLVGDPECNCTGTGHTRCNCTDGCRDVQNP